MSCCCHPPGTRWSPPVRTLSRDRVTRRIRARLMFNSVSCYCRCSCVPPGVNPSADYPAEVRHHRRDIRRRRLRPPCRAPRQKAASRADSDPGLTSLRLTNLCKKHRHRPVHCRLSHLTGSFRSTQSTVPQLLLGGSRGVSSTESLATHACEPAAATCACPYTPRASF